MEIGLLIEGNLDEVVASALLQRAALTKGTVYGKRGWRYIRDKAQGFNNASVGYPILAIVDFMDTGEDCAPSIRQDWIQNQHENMLFRVAIPEIESWLLADQSGFADFLGIRRHLVPERPDTVADAKSQVMQLASRSRYRSRREAIVPKAGYSSREGPLYTSELSIFVNNNWDIEAALVRSPSLQSAVKNVEEMAVRLVP